MAAPNPAPLKTPSIDGLTRGFTNIAWYAEPEIAKLAPIIMQAIILGRRISVIKVCIT